MKIKIIIYTIIAILIIPVFSCKRYEDGPILSLRSPDKRIQGWWVLEYTRKDGQLVDFIEIEWLAPVIDSNYVTILEEVTEEEVEIGIFTMGFHFSKDGNGKVFFVMTYNDNVGSFGQRFFSWTFNAEKTNLILNYNNRNFEVEILRLTNKELKILRREVKATPTIETMLIFTKSEDFDENLI